MSHALRRSRGGGISPTKTTRSDKNSQWNRSLAESGQPSVSRIVTQVKTQKSKLRNTAAEPISFATPANR